MHCMPRDAMRCAITSKRPRDFPMQIVCSAGLPGESRTPGGAKGALVPARDTGEKGESAKITVGNNAIDWEDELARALREMDNISLDRPLQGTIR